MDNVRHISIEDYEKLSKLLRQRSALRAEHANTPIGSYRLSQKVLMQRERKDALAFISKQIKSIGE